MEIALPVAVKFLQKGNRELSKNLASYLSLAAIEYAYLLSPHVQPILDSIVAGNYGLCRVLSQIYEVSPDQLTPHAALLVSLLQLCDIQERLALLQLFALIVQNKTDVYLIIICCFIHKHTAHINIIFLLLFFADWLSMRVYRFWRQVCCNCANISATRQLFMQQCKFYWTWPINVQIS